MMQTAEQSEESPGGRESGAKRLLNRLIFPVSAGAIAAEISYVGAGMFGAAHAGMHLSGIGFGLLGLFIAAGLQIWESRKA